jgi:hypothetical protein
VNVTSVVGILATFDGLESRANIPPERFNTFVTFFEQAQTLANHLAGCLV